MSDRHQRGRRYASNAKENINARLFEYAFEISKSVDGYFHPSRILSGEYDNILDDQQKNTIKFLRSKLEQVEIILAYHSRKIK